MTKITFPLFNINKKLNRLAMGIKKNINKGVQVDLIPNLHNNIIIVLKIVKRIIYEILGVNGCYNNSYLHCAEMKGYLKILQS